MEQKHKWKKEIIAWLDKEKVQWAGVDRENWQDLNDLAYPLTQFDSRCLKFRIAPKTININGHQVPEPCEEIKIFALNIDEREEIIEKVWSEMKDALCLDHRTFGHQLIEEVFKKRGEK